MSAGTVVWLLVGAIAALVFFGVAAVVTVHGIRELRDLLTRENH